MVHYNGHALDDNSAHLEGAIYRPRESVVFYLYNTPQMKTAILSKNGDL